MNSKMLQHIPLKAAYLCQDCESIGNCAVQCPACASRALMGLSGILDREAAEARLPLAAIPMPAYGANYAPGYGRINTLVA